MNAVEVAIRAYDPCLSCATHALGQMPLEIALYDSNNKLIQKNETSDKPCIQISQSNNTPCCYRL